MTLTSMQQDFPILAEKCHGKPLVYLDNGATTQKPRAVIAAIQDFYEKNNANIHRGVYELSQRATAAYEAVRKKAQHFIHAQDSSEIIFVRGTTEAINLVAHSFGAIHLQEGDEIVLTMMEHHSNIVPWQLLAERMKLSINVIPITAQGDIDLATIENYFSSRTKLLAMAHVSNVLGTINPLKEIIRRAHARGIAVVIDGAQAPAHVPVDVVDLDCDFYAFSSHKMYGPTGVGVLYGKKHWLDKMPPYQGGGDMIERVSFQGTTFQSSPAKFEAGTPDIANVIGFGAAIDYLAQFPLHDIIEHEKNLLIEATTQLKKIPGLKIIGEAAHKIGVISFVLETIHPHDIATILDHEGVAVRAGHHCAMPLMDYLKLPATVRVSFGMYNSAADIAVLMRALANVTRLFTVT